MFSCCREKKHDTYLSIIEECAEKAETEFDIVNIIEKQRLVIAEIKVLKDKLDLQKQPINPYCIVNHNIEDQSEES
jgi:hypothetical protein